MNLTATLHIHLYSQSPAFAESAAMCNRYHGGPEVLLQWLETQLALPPTASSHFQRVSEYLSALEMADVPVFRASLETDGWGTANELLLRRDGLLLAGWDGVATKKLPPVVEGLGQVEKLAKFSFPGMPERLDAVMDALAVGQVLPPHRVVLYDPLVNWPVKWRRILDRMDVEHAAPPRPFGKDGLALRDVQLRVLGKESKPARQDESFRFMSCSSSQTAAEAVALALAEDPGGLSQVVVCCESSSAALLIDGCLARLGLPTMGVAARTRSHPVHQVLPLAIALCWGPVDPDLLLDFLWFPVSPIPRRAARKLADALGEQPGLGSGKWEEAIEELCSSDDDVDGKKLRDRLDAWLHCARVPRGEPVSTQMLSQRCALVAQWAAGYAAVIREQEEKAVLAHALGSLASRAAAFNELVSSRGNKLAEPQVFRLLDAVCADGDVVQPHDESARGPLWVQSLGDIIQPCERLVWFGIGTDTQPYTRWTRHELEKLAKSGIDVDDGSKWITSLRNSERRGLASVSDALLAISLPQDEEKQPHPVWLQALDAMEEEHREPVFLDDHLLAGKGSVFRPWHFRTTSWQIKAPQPRRPCWPLPPELLIERDTCSATSLEDGLACPLKWVFRYQARLSTGATLRLPSDVQLKGTFLHSIFQALFGKGGTFSSMKELERRVAELFMQRLPLDAAPLARPDRLDDQQELLNELMRAVKEFARLLKRGNYQVAGIEFPVDAELDGRLLRGWIDCLLQRPDGTEGIVDFKYGASKYREYIERGRAVQLATYAFSRTEGGKKPFPPVAYLLLSRAEFLTPSGSPLLGVRDESILEAPSVQDVWNEFAAALNASDYWMSDGRVPARPLQEQDLRDWSMGASLVLDEDLSLKDKEKIQHVCQYCDFKALCGLEELE